MSLNAHRTQSRKKPSEPYFAVPPFHVVPCPHGNFRRDKYGRKGIYGALPEVRGLPEHVERHGLTERPRFLYPDLRHLGAGPRGPKATRLASPASTGPERVAAPLPYPFRGLPDTMPSTDQRCSGIVAKRLTNADFLLCSYERETSGNAPGFATESRPHGFAKCIGKRAGRFSNRLVRALSFGKLCRSFPRVFLPIFCRRK